jgi:hypothetical protein
MAVNYSLQFPQPTLAAENWEPNPLLPADYTPQPGGPTLAQLQASPLFQMMQSTAAGAPSGSLLKGWETSVLPGVLSGAIPITQANPEWRNYTAPYVDWAPPPAPANLAPGAPTPTYQNPFAPPPGPQALTPKDPALGYNPRPITGTGVGNGDGGNWNAGRFGGRPGTGGMGEGGGAAPMTPQPDMQQRQGGFGQQWNQWGGQQQPGAAGNMGGQQQRNPFSFGNSPWKSW